MTASKHLIALLRSHIEGDNEQFLSVAMQVAAHEARAGQNTALARVNIVEDAVVEHDARHVPGYDLVVSDVTGHAVFERRF